MSKAEYTAHVRDVITRAEALRDLSRAHGYDDLAAAAAMTAAEAALELTFLQNGWESGPGYRRLFPLPACNCGCRDCDHP